MSLKITKAGILDTVQDLGRNGHRHLGVNPSGAMDSFSAQLSNALLGKDLADSVIELHFPASSFLFEKDTTACICGGNFSPFIDDQAVALNQPFCVRSGTTLKFTKLQSGARAYLSIVSGLNIPLWLGSYSTNLRAGAGGWQGRSLKTNDQLPFKHDTHLPFFSKEKPMKKMSWKAAEIINDCTTLNCLYGNEWDWLTDTGKRNVLNTTFLVKSNSDRMGYYLQGKKLSVRNSAQLVSTAVDSGTIQLLPNGQLIILMTDHQTTGGYPRIAHVTTCSLSSVAQLKPNAVIRFNFISMKEAEQELFQRRNYLDQLRLASKARIEKVLS